MVRQPSVFLMDEPLSNLDAQLRVHMRDELADLHARLGATFIYVTHDQVEAMTMSTRVAMLDAGRLVQVGSPRDLYERPATLAVARFIGSPMINVLPGRIGEFGELRLLDQIIPVTTTLKPGSAVSIGLRAEDLSMKSGTGIAGPALAARIRRVEHHGADRLVFADLVAPAVGSLIARISGISAHGIEPALSDMVRIGLSPSRLHVFDARGERVPVNLAAARTAHEPNVMIERAVS